MEPKQKVFVTGASSQLLQYVIDLIPSDTFQIVGLSRSKQKPTNKMRWCTGNLHSPETYAHELADCTMIIHAAALTHSHNKQKYYQVNVKGTKTLINTIPPGSNPLFVFISSRTAGNKSGAYGQSKLKAETLVKNSVSRWIILRPAEIFGGTKNEGIDSTIVSALKGGFKPFPMHVPSKMYPLHVKDAARAIYEATFVHGSENTCKYINGKVGYSYKELLQLIARTSNKQIYGIPVPKFMLVTAATLCAMLQIDVGIVADQIPRLYAIKKHKAKPSYQTISLQEYILFLVQKPTAARTNNLDKQQ